MSEDDRKTPDGLRAFRPLVLLAAAIGVILGVVDFEGAGLTWQRLLTVGAAAIAIFLASIAFRMHRRIWGWLLSLVAVVYLPIWYAVVAWLWWTVDGLAVVVLLLAAWQFRGPPPEPDPDNLPDQFL